MTTIKKAYPVGTLVRSHYRAAWTGVVVASGADHNFTPRGTCGRHIMYESVAVTRDNLRTVPSDQYPWNYLSHPGCVLVKVTHDRNGHPLRKPLWKVLDSAWLAPV